VSSRNFKLSSNWDCHWWLELEVHPEWRGRTTTSRRSSNTNCKY